MKSSKFEEKQALTRKHAVEAFKDHKVTVLCNTPEVQMFKCRRPGTSEYSFQVVCADNMICLTGDIDSILVEPGYGRNGTRFLRGQAETCESYFLSKVKNTEAHTEYDEDYAEEYLLRCIKDAKEEEDLVEKYESVLETVINNGRWGERQFHDAWADNDLDEHPNMRVISGQAIFQMEAFKWLARELDSIGFEIAPKVVPISPEVSTS